MDCNTALRRLEVCRPSDGDWADADLTLAMAHVNQCPNCRDEFRARQLFDTRVAATMQDVPVPLELRNRIFSRLEAQSVPQRRSLRRIARFAALAAAAALILISAS